MPSHSATRIQEALEEFLGRPLTRPEIRGCEEMMLNYFPKAVFGYIQRLVRMNLPRSFDSVYRPVMGGLLKGACKRTWQISLSDSLGATYDKFARFLPEKFNDYEMDAILQLDAEPVHLVDKAIAYAKSRGIFSAAYVKACVLSEKAKKELMVSKKKVSPMDALPTLKAMDRLRAKPGGFKPDSWRQRAELTKAETTAKRAMPNDKRSHPTDQRGNTPS